MCQSAYGFRIKPTNDPYVRTAQEGLEIAEGLIPGTFLVDAIPICESAAE